MSETRVPLAKGTLRVEDFYQHETPVERAFAKAARILKELREMGEPLASFTLFSDGSGSLTLSRNLTPEVKRFAEFYLNSVRWGVDDDGRRTLTTCEGLLDD